VLIRGGRFVRHRPTDTEIIGKYEAVGLTWWVEKLGWFRSSLTDVRRRIEAGPPGRISVT
jgi:hypothetical protein